MMLARDTLELGPFLWLGGPTGREPWLSSAARSAGTQRATKGGRGAIEEVAAALFGWLGASTTIPGREAAHHAILLRRLRANASPVSFPTMAIRMARAGAVRRVFSMPGSPFGIAPPSSRTYIDGFRLAQREGLGDLQDFYWTILAEAERTGTWSGTTLELWLALFAAHRAIRHGGYEPGGEAAAGWMDSATP